MKKLVIIAVLVQLALIAVGVNAQGQAREQWEYKVENIWMGKAYAEPQQQRLNKLGVEGWELVTITPNIVDAKSIDVYVTMILKRKVVK